MNFFIFQRLSVLVFFLFNLICPNYFANYRPQTKFAKVIFLQLSVILFTGGVCLSACWDTTTTPGTQDQTPLPLSRHPRDQSPPPTQEQAPPPTAQCMLGDTVNRRAVCILLECNLVWKCNRVSATSVGVRDPRPPVYFFTFSCSFWQRLCHIIGYRSML